MLTTWKEWKLIPLILILCNFNRSRLRKIEGMVPVLETFFFLKKQKNPHFYQCYCHNQYQQYRAETKFGWFKYSLIIPPHFQYQKEKWLLVNGSCCSAVHNPKIKCKQIQSSLLTKLGWKKLLLLHSHAIIISPKAGQGGLHIGKRKAQTLLATKSYL